MKGRNVLVELRLTKLNIAAAKEAAVSLEKLGFVWDEDYEPIPSIEEQTVNEQVMDSLKGVGLAFDSNYQEAPLFSNEPSQANQFLAVEDILCVRGEIPEEKIPEIEASKEASLRKKQCRGALGKLK